MRCPKVTRIIFLYLKFFSQIFPIGICKSPFAVVQSPTKRYSYLKPQLTLYYKQIIFVDMMTVLKAKPLINKHLRASVCCMVHSQLS